MASTAVYPMEPIKQQEQGPVLHKPTTLEDARWSALRKKAGISRKVNAGVNLHKDEPNFLKKLNQYVHGHFHQKECQTFVPKPGQTVQGPELLKCHCGDVLKDHFVVRKQKKSSNLKSSGSLDIGIQWTKEQAIKKSASTTYGKINFVNVDNSRGRKPAKFIRLSDDDSVDNLLKMMEVFWGINKPKPNLVISVVGGAKNFKMDIRMRDKFTNGLLKAAKPTSAWLITSGCNYGIMKAVGHAVSQGQTFTWFNDRMTHVMKCIGFTPWGYVRDRFDLEPVDDKSEGRFNAEYKASDENELGLPAPLNSDHTHFVFVDDGIRNTYKGGAIDFRSSFENIVHQPESDKGMNIPVVLLVVEGGTDALEYAHKTLQNGIPVVVCSGTGRAADILAFAHQCTCDGLDITESSVNYLKKKILEVYKEYWKATNADIDKEKEIILKLTLECCKKTNLITVFHMDKHEDLDASIQIALLKAQRAKLGESEEQRLKLLKLALMMNRVDTAEKEIFSKDITWSSKSLHTILSDSLNENKVDFVRLIIQHGTAMKEYLSVLNLQRLYNEDFVTKHSYLYKILHRVTGKDEEFNLEDISRLLKKVMDIRVDFTAAGGETEDGYCLQPYKHLLIWAVLMNRQSLAKLFWEMGDEPITSAIAVTRIQEFMVNTVSSNESVLREDIKENRREFETLAIEVLNECHRSDPTKTMILVEKESPTWNKQKCLELAAAASSQPFIASMACQNSINATWKLAILSPWWRIMVAMLFPPLIFFWIRTSKMGGALTAGQRFLLYYKAPVTKFAHHMLMYATFLVLFTYMVLVDFKTNEIAVTEWICMVWIFTYIVDEIHTIVAFSSSTIKGKFYGLYDFLKVLDVLNLYLALVGFALHLYAWLANSGKDVYQSAKNIYCINCITFYLHVMKLLSTNSKLGPKMYMIRRMVKELGLFLVILMLFLLAYGVSSQGLLYIERTRDWSILKDIVYFPYWQLYGEIFLDEITTDQVCLSAGLTAEEDKLCRQENWLVPIMLALYLLVGNVLLLNLLIAIFSHVFTTVEDRSIEIWKYQMYYLVMEYDNKTALVPPLSIITHIYLVFKWIGRRTCFTKKTTVIYSTRQQEYLQLFEKEMMANYLRRKRSDSRNTLEMRVGRLQERMEKIEEDVLRNLRQES